MNRENLQDFSYVGDGCYVGHDGYQFWLFLSDGIRDYNFIALEPAMVSVFHSYTQRIRRKYNKSEDQNDLREG